MEETLGKRIAACRKRLGITQDKLAEQLGVTAQAVSKWENDQSCPDITMLPKLAEIFGTSTDALLGLAEPQPEPALEAEIVTDSDNDSRGSEGLHSEKNNWELRWDGGRKGSIAFAFWILLVGGLLLASNLLNWNAGLWDILWPSALLVFGLSGLFPTFSFFSLGCSLFGGYFLLDNLNLLPFELGRNLLLPVFLLLFGLSLLVDAFRKHKKGRFHVTHNGKNIGHTQKNCTMDDESFESSLSFGEDTHYIDLPRLHSGSASVSFGELTVDLTGCEEFAPGCRIEANCSFGELEILVPRRYRVEANSGTSFGSVDFEGHPDPAPAGTILLDGSVSFGELSVRYI